MTAVTNGRTHYRAPAEDPRPQNWDRIAVILAVLAHLGGAIWFASAINRRIAAIEEQVSPGIIQRLDERTLTISSAVDRIEKNLDERANGR